MQEFENTILIVEDEPSARETLVSILEPEGYNLVLAKNGYDAIDRAKELHPDVILLDVMMPGMDGFDVCRAIRKDDVLMEVPILFMTALNDRKSRLEGLEAGADEFISKPYDRHELRTRLNSIMRLNRYRKLLDERVKLENAHQELLAAYDATIAGWSHAMDLRDKETEGHTQRVAELTLKLGEAMQLGKDELIQLRRGALLHDMGKLGVPDAILQKPGKLNDEEWQLMRQHPQYAYDMLYPIEYLRPAIDIPYAHHEKWDGTGYPRGLQGEGIPLAARIFAVVDVWDALTSDRPYRPALEREKVVEYIKEQTGKHFDPDIVDLFLAVI